ncbi:MAG TPA: aminotransferase class V-fold PLP-dependent enzyme [Thermoanaerobaculia bacterium]|nr:aminotransferase class V-fold PLP-dependent enzyme [Thermoanaerobaculia bacterium]HUM30346.1 aminotransferase class V-fold PLP-dependent enzyme [Thermoanaerobaculia bacterium]HXK68503.1 aminotransferase class V-fold PLP-dependent enzyme [Thermoanaerobaculia bacterium]
MDFPGPGPLGSGPAAFSVMDGIPMERRVFLDVENGYYVAEDVVQAMLPYFNREGYGHTGMTHAPGWEAYQVLQESGTIISNALGFPTADGLHFPHDTTEANNLAILGSTRNRKGSARGVVVSQVEPLSVLHCAERLSREGFSLHKIKVDSDGTIDLDRLKDAVNEETMIISIAMVNAETGTIQPMKEIIRLIRDRSPEALIHSDLSDAFGKIPLRLPDLDLDMATFSSTKLLGPRGVAGLWVKQRKNVNALLEGAYSTQPLWPGDENIPAIAGFAAAVKAHFFDFDHTLERLNAMRDRLMNELLTLPDSLLNGPRTSRASDNVNISFLHAEGEALTVDLADRGIYVSSGSACSRKILQPSHVLMAMGRKFEEAHGSILMKVHRCLTDEDVDHILESFPLSLIRLRTISGAYREES